MITEPVLPGQDEESIALERSILGRLIIHPERMYEVTDVLTPCSFYRDIHQQIFAALVYLHNEQQEITAFSVLNRLGDEGDFSYVMELTNYDPCSLEIAPDARLLEQKAYQRALVFKAPTIAHIGYVGGTIPEMQLRAQAELDSLKQVHRAKDVPLSEIMCDVRDEIDLAYMDRASVRGIPTGLRTLDQTVGNLQPKQLILLAGRPSMGKSALAFQIGYHAALLGCEVATYSLEMGARDIGFRYLSLATGIPMRRLKNGRLLEEEWGIALKQMDALSELPLTINDTSGQPVSSIRDALLARQAARGKPAELVIVDYLQLMESEVTGKDHTRVQEIDQIAHGLLRIAKDFNVPLLACAQLSRAVEGRVSKIPQMSDLRESGGLEQAAHIVMLLYRDDYYNRPDEDGHATSSKPGIADLIIAKNRNDMTGELQFRWNGPLTRFEER